MPYTPTYHPDGRKVYNPSRTERDIHDEWDIKTAEVKAAHPEMEDWRAEMRGRELWRQEEERKERWSEWQDRVWCPRMRRIALGAFNANESERAVALNKEEIERLIEHFAGANDPVAQSILAKSMATLSRAIGDA